MGWTAPATWTVGELVLASKLNTHVRDNLLAIGPHLIARKTADESVTSSTVLQNDDHLVTPSIPANEVWRFEHHLLYTGSTAGDLKLAWTVPTGALTYSYAAVQNSAAAVQVFAAVDNVGGADILLTDLACTGTTGAYQIVYLTIANGGTAGTVQLRWAQQTSNATATTIKTNSTLWGVKLA